MAQAYNYRCCIPHVVLYSNDNDWLAVEGRSQPDMNQPICVYFHRSTRLRPQFGSVMILNSARQPHYCTYIHPCFSKKTKTLHLMHVLVF